MILRTISIAGYCCEFPFVFEFAVALQTMKRQVNTYTFDACIHVRGVCHLLFVCGSQLKYTEMHSPLKKSSPHIKSHFHKIE